MTQWEYCFESFRINNLHYNDADVQEMKKRLDALGQDNWEAYSILWPTSESKGDIIVALKRELPTRPRRC